MAEVKMRRLGVFNNVTLDGYITDQNGDMSWAHGPQDEEFNSFVEGNSRGDSELLFGRITYEMMASFWPTPQAIAQMPIVAQKMNGATKIVFSRTLSNASWSNSRLVKGDLLGEVRKMKNAPGPDIVIFGSGQIVSQLCAAGLIDRYQIVLSPIALGKGRSMFEGIGKKLPLRLTDSRVFKSGKVFLSYEA
jgi:dihydrofolate reductase